jgi:O-phospho-L-seryl-tRNASec:L-selenocysteinyl-tRNA synthase
MINMGLQKRIDAFVQSTDKNFMVPVGGAIIASGSKETLEQISKTYPGRASASPIVDLFITLTSMGRSGFIRLLDDRQEVFAYFKQKMESLASQFGERVLHTPGNQISLALTLDSFAAGPDSNPTQIGATLFNSCTSGIRVVVPGKSGKMVRINGYEFVGYGAHHDAFPSVYLTVAAAIGMTKDDVDLTISRITKVLTKASKHLAASTKDLTSTSPN